MEPREKIKCPHCGYKMPIYRDKKAVCEGIYVKCKARKCGKSFEIIIKDK